MLKKMFYILVITMMIITVLAGCSSTDKSTYTIVYETQTDSLNEQQFNDAKDIITNRFEAIDCKHIKVTRTGDKGLKVELSGDELIKTQVEIIGKQNEFKIVGPDDSVLLTSMDVFDAASQESPNTKTPVIYIKFDKEGKEKFTAATSANIGKQLKICLDDNVISSPTVVEAITDGQPIIAGNWSSGEAKELAYLIKSKKSLPFSFSVVSISPN